MTRTLAPKPKRKEFTPKTRALARERSQGLCEVHRVRNALGSILDYRILSERCSRKIEELDHIQKATAKPDNSISNAAYLCKPCHKIKSAIDLKLTAKSNRLRGEAGQSKRRAEGKTQTIQSAGFRGHRKFNGERVWK